MITKPSIHSNKSDEFSVLARLNDFKAQKEILKEKEANIKRQQDLLSTLDR